MRRLAWLYISLALLAGTLLVVLTLPSLPAFVSQNVSVWLTWSVLTLLATSTQLFKTLLKSRQHSDSATTSYSPFLVFLFAGVLLLPPPLFVLQVFIPHLVEWIRDRLLKKENLPAWYIQPFNVATHIIAGLFAAELYARLLQEQTEFQLSSVVSVACAAIVYTAINHLLVGGALVLARGVSWRESGCLAPENLLPDFLMLILGGAVAKLWGVDPWLILLILSMLVLIYRALQVPQLKKDAHTDPKTGLLNTRRFNELAAAELERARRFDRPLAVVMADLDLLRDVNNTYGHLAGDAVLNGIGHIICDTVRDYDIAGRFGGEEFAILLPEVEQDKARAFAEKLRKAIESASFAVSTSPTPIRVTMSIGVSCFPEDGATLAGLIHEADVAVYQAKLHGRNRVICSSAVPHSLKLTDLPAVAEYAAATRSNRAGTSSASVARVAGAAIDSPDDAVVAAEAAGQQQATHEIPAVAEVEEQAPSTKRQAKKYPRGKLGIYLAMVIASGVLATVGGLVIGWRLDPMAIILLLLLTVMAEVLQANYGDSTISVAVAVVFAAALVPGAGIPAVALLSLSSALIHYVRIRPDFHVSAFNWAIHVLAGCPPALLVALLALRSQSQNPGPFDPRSLLFVDNLLVLAVPAIVAGILYFVIETGLIANAISLSTESKLVATWREQFQWSGGHYLVLCLMGLLLAVSYVEQGALGVAVFAAPVLMMRYAQQQYVDRTKASMQELKRLNGELGQANSEVVAASTAIRKLNDELFLTLAKILDARDPYVSNHSTQVATYAAAIATEMGLPTAQVELCRQAGFLHDIGKIAISEQILHKPSKLTVEEYEILKTHAAIGAEFLETSQGLRHLAPFVRGHHEQWDGRGYPYGLKREDIPLEARILAVCDSVEAMASDRPYKVAKSLDEIITEVRRCSGTQFDPEVAEVFIRLAEREGTTLVINSALAVVRKQQGDTRELVTVVAEPDREKSRKRSVTAA